MQSIITMKEHDDDGRSDGKATEHEHAYCTCFHGDVTFPDPLYRNINFAGELNAALSASII